MTIRWTPAALNDIKSIHAYTNQQSRHSAPAWESDSPDVFCSRTRKSFILHCNRQVKLLLLFLCAIGCRSALRRCRETRRGSPDIRVRGLLSVLDVRRSLRISGIRQAARERRPATLRLGTPPHQSCSSHRRQSCSLRKRSRQNPASRLE